MRYVYICPSHDKSKTSDQKRPCGKLCSRCQGTPTILTLTKAVLLSVFDNCDRHGGGHDTSCHPLDFQIFQSVKPRSSVQSDMMSQLTVSIGH